VDPLEPNNLSHPKTKITKIWSPVGADSSESPAALLVGAALHFEVLRPEPWQDTAPMAPMAPRIPTLETSPSLNRTERSHLMARQRVAATFQPIRH
jgi:hypothetical protein